MVELLIITDDFTGALDTGIQFSAHGVSTRVITSTDGWAAARRERPSVLVIDAETRHLPAEQAYQVVYRITARACEAGVAHIYKKTDSALRGNVGAELKAVMDAAKASRIVFAPAFPKMNRVVRDGILYIDDKPVSESVFGRDSFEPVGSSEVAELLRRSADMPVIPIPRGAPVPDRDGIWLFDAESEEDLRSVARRAGAANLRVSAGCAGFAAVFSESFSTRGAPHRVPELPSSLLVACGSRNPISIRQLDVAEASGFPRICLSPAQKLDDEWLLSADGQRRIDDWIRLVNENGIVMLDANDTIPGKTDEYAGKLGMSSGETRGRVSEILGKIIRRMLDGGMNAAILCTGGDTALALMRSVGADSFVPLCELVPGTVLTSFEYRSSTCCFIVKSGGFGEPGLLCELGKRIDLKRSVKKGAAVC